MPHLIFAWSFLQGTIGGIVGAVFLPWFVSGVVAYTAVGMGLMLRVSRPGILGMFFGALSGAAAADTAEVADLVFWPGHTSEWAITAVLVVALSWLVGELVTPPDEVKDPSPFWTGLGLYVLTLVLCAGPVVWQVML